MNMVMMAWALGAILLFAGIGRAADDAADAYEERELKYTGGMYQDHVFKYRLMKPAKVEAGKKYPLVLFLHGAGERGTDNLVSLKYLPTWLAEPENRQAFPCYVLVPQCPPDPKMWIDKHWALREHSMSPQPTDEMKAVIAMLKEVMDKESVDSGRIYLTGLSMGGYGSWELAARHPELFAAVVPICGGGDEASASKLAGLPIWAWHGTDDQAVPVERSRRMIAAIKAAGGNPRYTELEHVNHNSWAPAYRSPDLLMWMFRQSRPAK
jgi:predicted peptidase